MDDIDQFYTGMILCLLIGYTFSCVYVIVTLIKVFIEYYK